VSVSSFPRSEHITLLREKITERVRLRQQSIEVVEHGLNHLKCQYKFGLRNRPEEDWIELAIHFQSAERLETTRNDAEINRIVDAFLSRHFA
jgi:hypothetical protein